MTSVGDENQDVTESSHVDDVNLSMTSSASQISTSQNSESKSIVHSIGTPEDRKAYRTYRIRKTSNLVNKCISKGTKFPKYLVDLSKAFLTNPDTMDLNDIEILNMRCTNALNQDYSGSDSDDQTKKSETIPKHKKRAMEPVPLPVTQSSPVYPATHSWPGPQFPYYGYDQGGYKYQQQQMPTPSFSTGFKFNPPATNPSPITSPFTTSTPNFYQQQLPRTGPTPPPPFQAGNLTQPSDIPTDLSGFRTISANSDQNITAVNSSKNPRTNQVKTGYLNIFQILILNI